MLTQLIKNEIDGKHIQSKILSAQAACVNPAALAGGKAELHAYLSSGFNGVSTESAQPRPWATGTKIETPFVSLPGLLTGECVSNDAGSYLAITTNGNPSDPRTDEIPGDVVANGRVMKDWGLHLNRCARRDGRSGRRDRAATEPDLKSHALK